MTHVRVKPAREGESLVHPLDGPLDAEGGPWRRDQFTFKRLRDGDVIEVDKNGEPVKPPVEETEDGEEPSAPTEPEAKSLPAPSTKARVTPSPTTGPSAADTSKE